MNKKGDVFRQEALDRINTPEQFNKRYKATTISMWIVLGALVVLALGVLFWIFFGVVEVDVRVKGITRDGESFCWVKLEDMQRIKEGMPAFSENDAGKVESVDKHAMSYDEIRGEAGDGFSWLGLDSNSRYYEVSIDTDEKEDKMELFRIVLKQVHPIDLLLNLSDKKGGA